MNKKTVIQKRIAAVAKELAREKKTDLDERKREYRQLKRPDFLWHYLLQSFATMGRASGWKGLIDNKKNYEEVTFDTLEQSRPKERAKKVEQTFRTAKIRMPKRKTKYLIGCFEKVRELGGPEAAKRELLRQSGRDSKIQFLKSFPGIGDKYARNIMMDVYHKEFRNSIAIDARIKSLTQAWGLSFTSYAEHESFLLSAAAEVGLNGWELDRLMFNYLGEFTKRVPEPKSKKVAELGRRAGRG